MLNLSFSYYDLEYFLLIFVRVSCFIFITPFFNMSNTPARVRVALSFFISVLMYSSLSPADAVLYDSFLEFAIIVIKEAIAGIIIGYGTTICTAIVNFAGSIVDMETGLSMVSLMDPATKQASSISGIFYQYTVMMLLIVTGMYQYLLKALAESFELIPINGAVFHGDKMLDTVVGFMADYLVIGFRICLPVFCVILLLNAILGVLAKVSPQMNMFAVGLQLKVLVGLSVLFLTVGMLPDAANFIFLEIKKVTAAFVGVMQ